MNWILAFICLGLIVALQYLREDRDYWRDRAETAEVKNIKRNPVITDPDDEVISIVNRQKARRS